MNDKNILKTLWGVIIVLLIMNVGMMSWIWFMSNKPPKMPEKFFLEQELNFNEEQKGKYREMRNNYFAEMRIVRDSIKPMKEAMLKRVVEDSLSDAEVLKISMTTESKMARANVLTFKHLREVRNFCTPEQRQKFDKLIDKIANLMARPEPPPRIREGNPPPDGERPLPPQGELPPH